MSPSWPRNLKAAIEQHGTPAATGPIVSLVEHAFAINRERLDAERFEARGTLDKQTMYLSDFGSECIRQLYLGRANVPKTNPLTVDSLMNFMIGNAVEEAVAAILSWLGCDIIREHHITLEYNGTKATGRVDFLVDIPLQVLEDLGLIEDAQGSGLPERVLAELKSTSSKAMIAMIVNQEAGKEGHRHQLNGYLHASHKGQIVAPAWLETGSQEFPDTHEWICPDCQVVRGSDHKPKCRAVRTYDTGFLIYVVKDATKGSPNIFAFRQDYSLKMVGQDLELVAYVERKVEKGADPGIPPDIMAKAKNGKPPVWPCLYCGWEDFCWSR